LTISGADIGSIYRKCTYTCKSRDSRKTSKKQNLEFKDCALYLTFNFEAASLINDNQGVNRKWETMQVTDHVQNVSM
jgi:cytidylate kinase